MVDGKILIEKLLKYAQKFLHLEKRDEIYFRNILQLAKENRTSEIEQIARNICASKGLDFDSEFRAFRNNLKL